MARRPIYNIHWEQANDQSWWDKGELIAAVLGLLLAAFGVTFAYRAWRDSQRTLAIAEDEHTVFLEQLTARADFKLAMKLLRPLHFRSQGILAKEREVTLRWSLGLRNRGRKATTLTGINFLVPGDLKNLKWVNGEGKPIPDISGRAGPLTSFDVLSADNDKQRAIVKYLIKTLDRVGTRGDVVMFAEATVVLPEVGDERVIRTRFKAWADELPDELDEVSCFHEITVKRTH